MLLQRPRTRFGLDSSSGTCSGPPPPAAVQPPPPRWARDPRCGRAPPSRSAAAGPIGAAASIGGAGLAARHRSSGGSLLPPPAAAGGGGGSKGFGGAKKATTSKANSRAAQRCPCGSGTQYQACCGRYHAGTLAPTPETLLRARFSAYSLQVVDYLVATTHKENPEHTGDPVTYARAVQRTARATEYLELRLLPQAGEPQGGSGAGEGGGDDAFLRFSVRWRPRSGGPEELMTEVSHFKRVGGAWLYYSAAE